MKKDTWIELDVFENWLLHKLGEYHSGMIEYKLSDKRPNQEKPALVILLSAFDGRKGEISFWSSGEAEVYVLDKNADYILPARYIMVKTPNEFEAAFREFFKVLTETV